MEGVNSLLHYGTNKVVLRYLNRPLCKPNSEEWDTNLPAKTIRLQFSNSSFDPTTDYPCNCSFCGGTGLQYCDSCKSTGKTLCTTCKGSGASETCPDCNGTGIVTGTLATSCPTCDGTGFHGGQCTVCLGTGNDGTDCSACNGTGFTEGTTCTYCNGTKKGTTGWKSGVTITKVTNLVNTYDFYYDSSDWGELFYGLCAPLITSTINTTKESSYGHFTIIDGNLSGVTTAVDMFFDSGLKDILKLKMDDVTDLTTTFAYCVLMESIERISVKSAATAIGTLYTTMRMQRGITSLYNQLKTNDAIHSGTTKYYPTTIATFTNSGYLYNDTYATTGLLSELNEIPAEWGGFKQDVITASVLGNWIAAPMIDSALIRIGNDEIGYYVIFAIITAISDTEITAHAIGHLDITVNDTETVAYDTDGNILAYLLENNVLQWSETMTLVRTDLPIVEE